MAEDRWPGPGALPGAAGRFTWVLMDGEVNQTFRVSMSGEYWPFVSFGSWMRP